MRVIYLSAILGFASCLPLGAVDLQRELKMAQRALADHLPELAVERLRPLLREEGQSPQMRRNLKRQLLEALVRSGSPEAAEMVEDPDLVGIPDVDFWEGHALRLIGQPENALAKWTSVVADPASSYKAEARFAMADLFDESGDSAAAMHVVAPLLEDEDPKLVDRASVLIADIDLREGRTDLAEERLSRVFASEQGLTPPPRYLRVQVALKRGQYSQAVDQMRQMIAQPEGLSEQVVHQTHLDLALALMELRELTEARRVMEDFIDAYPTSAALGQAFSILKKAGAFNGDRVYPKLVSWTQSAVPHLKAYATYYEGIAQQKLGQDAEALLRFQTISLTPDHPLSAEATLKLVELYLNREDAESAYQALLTLPKSKLSPEIQTQVNFLKGQTQFARGEYEEAFQLFRAGDATDPNVKMRFWFNASLAALKGGRQGAFEQAQQSLRHIGTEDSVSTEGARLQGEVLLRKGLEEAASPETRLKSVSTLKQFIADHPNHEGVPRARLSLAELGLLMSPRNLQLAEDNIKASRSDSQPLEEEIEERLYYLEIWVASLRGDRDKVIELGKAFIAYLIENHPQSSYKAEARMKIAEAYFEKQDYVSAGNELNLLAEESPASPLANQARFLAGRAALNAGKLEEAIDVWTELVKDGDDSFQLLARHQQALALCQKGNWADALVQFDEILRVQPEENLLFRVLVAKGECLTVLGEKEPDQYREALLVFDQVIRHPEVPPYWRDEALVRKGLVYRTLGDDTQAMLAFEEVLYAEDNTEGSPPSSHWYYRAGFEALAVLERDNNLKGALKIADHMGKSQSDRAADARYRADRLRLKPELYDNDSTPE